jgi:peptide/nickel transport system substrate-binding protein
MFGDYTMATRIVTILIGLTLVLAVACGSAAPEPTAVPDPTAATAADAAPAAEPTAAPTSQPTPAEPLSERPESAKNSAVAVIALEPEHLFPMRQLDAHGGTMRDTFVATIGHLQKETLELSPTPLVESWGQTAPDEWEYELRPGVTFHDGAEWNARAWQTYAEFAGVPEFGTNEFSRTGPYTAEPIGDLRVRIQCGAPCPVFARGLSQAQVVSPRLLRESDFTTVRECICAGPYKVDEWRSGQFVRTSIFENYASIPNTEFATPIVEEIEWQWRQESAVRAAMIEAEEADWAFLLASEDAERLGSDRFTTGGTAEQAWLRFDTIWDPWLKQKEMRQAVVHAIDCQGIVDSLYDGRTTCRGNLGVPGMVGLADTNLEPYEYDPALSRGLLEEIGYICGMENSAPNCEAEIAITSRPARIPRNVELIEAMVGFMREAGINAEANIVETGIWGPIFRCGIGSEGAQRAGYQGATETTKPSFCDPGQITEVIGSDYVTLNYGAFVTRRLLCNSVTSTVCVPERDAEWTRATTLSGEERARALETIADEVKEEVYALPMFDLVAYYGINPNLRGFEEPRFDKRLFANLWWFEE